MYTDLANKLRHFKAIDESTYINMMKLTDPSDRVNFLSALCNGFLDKQIILSKGMKGFMSKG